MKYHVKQTQTIEAVQFDGTFTGERGVQFIDDWLKEHDIENCEVTAQGTKEPLALDLMNAFGMMTLEKGDFLVITPTRRLRGFKKEDFEDTYEKHND